MPKITFLHQQAFNIYIACTILANLTVPRGSDLSMYNHTTLMYIQQLHIPKGITLTCNLLMQIY